MLQIQYVIFILFKMPIYIFFIENSSRHIYSEIDIYLMIWNSLQLFNCKEFFIWNKNMNKRIIYYQDD